MVIDTAIYVRVSKRDMHTENQLIDLELYAKNMNWDYEVFEERESTRKTRPIKERLLSLLRQRKFSRVLVWKLDRWGRSVSELALEVDELTGKGINFISLRDNIDLNTPTGRLQFHMLSAFAEFERALIRERTLQGLERARRQGKILGRPKGCKDKRKRKRRWKRRPG